MAMYWILLGSFAYLYTGFFFAMEDYYKYKEYKDDFHKLDENSQNFILDMDEIMESGEFKKTVFVYMFMWLPLQIEALYYSTAYKHFNLKKINVVFYRSQKFNLGYQKIKNFIPESQNLFHVFEFPLFGILIWKEKENRIE